MQRLVLPATHRFVRHHCEVHARARQQLDIAASREPPRRFLLSSRVRLGGGGSAAWSKKTTTAVTTVANNAASDAGGTDIGDSQDPLPLVKVPDEEDCEDGEAASSAGWIGEPRGAEEEEEEGGGEEGARKKEQGRTRVRNRREYSPSSSSMATNSNSSTDTSSSSSSTAPGASHSSTVKVVVFSARDYELPLLRRHVTDRFPGSEILLDTHLTAATARLAAGFECVSLFVDDDASEAVVRELAQGGTKMIAMRCVGCDRVDLDACRRHGVRVVNVPAYSPTAIAEHALAMTLCLNRHIVRAHNRVREGNFTLSGGLIGRNLAGKTAGILGTGKIGRELAKKLKGMDMRVLGYDAHESDSFVGDYVSLEEILAESDLLSLHLPMTPSTFHIIDGDAVEKMKSGVTLINTGRGGLVDSAAVRKGLMSRKIGALGMDVYEEEEHVFDRDFTCMSDAERLDCWNESIENLVALRNLPNVLMTPHQAFLTDEALEEICASVGRSVGQLSSALNDAATDARLDNECCAGNGAVLDASARKSAEEARVQDGGDRGTTDQHNPCAHDADDGGGGGDAAAAEDGDQEEGRVKEEEETGEKQDSDMNTAGQKEERPPVRAHDSSLKNEAEEVERREMDEDDDA